MDARKLEELKADLSAFLDGELPPERRRELERALAESDEMRQLAGELREVAAHMSALPRVSAPPELAAALGRAAANLSDVAAVTQGSRVVRFRPMLRWSAVAALVGLGVFLSWRALLDPRERAAPRPSAMERIAIHESAPYAPGPAADSLAAAKPAESALQPHAETMAKSGRVSPAPALPPAQVVVSDGTSFEADASVAPPIAAADALADPVVEIVVRTRDAGEFARLSATLGSWPGEPVGGSAEEKSAAPTSFGLPEPLVLTGRLAAADLPARIDELAVAVGQAGQVRVSLNFDASQGDALFVQAARGMRGRSPGAGLLVDPEANPRAAEQSYFASRAPRSALSAGRGGTSGALPQPESTPAAAPPAASAGGGRAAGRPPPPIPRRSFDDARDQATIRREIAERHRQVTEEPVLPEDLFPPEALKRDAGKAQPLQSPASPTSVPLTPAGPPRPEENASGEFEQLGKPQRYIDRLIDLLFMGANASMAATQPTEQIGFRVLLLPPDLPSTGEPPATAEPPSSPE